MKHKYKEVTPIIGKYMLLLFFAMAVAGSYATVLLEGDLDLFSSLTELAGVTGSAKEADEKSILPISGLRVPCPECSEPFSAGTGECQDFDGDGVANKCDLDDDNDGVPDTQEMVINEYINTSCENNLIEREGYNTPFTLKDQLADKLGLIVGASNSYSIGFPLGNTCSKISFGNGASTFNAYIYFKFVNPYNTAQNVPLNYMTITSDCVGSNEIAEYDAYDINGNFLYNKQLTTTPAYGANHCVTIRPPDGVNVYSIRVRQVASASILSGISLKGISSAQDRDSDNDGIPNRLENDSDGDGCSDSFEAGAITTEVSGHRFSSTPDVNQNGLNDNVENGATGQTNYSSTYNPYAISVAIRLCTDTDNDGVRDLDDIDMDNDGIINSTESPNCFYTAREFESGSRNSFVKVTTGFNMVVPYTTPRELVDGDAGTSAANYAVQFVNGQAITAGSNIYTFEFAAPIKLRNIYLRYASGNHFGAATMAKLQGSTNGSIWTDLNSGASYGTRTTGPVLSQGSMTYQVFTVSSGSAARYKYYRIAGISGTTSGGASNEAYFEVASDFVSSANPKPACSQDTDGDGTLNHLDLDSDGDTCPDVYEGRVPGATKGTGTYTDNVVVDPATPAAGVGTNGYKNTLETSVDSNIPNSTPSYYYAIAPSLNICADTDNDGILDIEDIDDDNDGIVDVNEQTCTPSNIASASSKNGIIITKPSTINYSVDVGQTLANLVDGVDADDIIIYNPTGTLNNAEWFRVEFPIPKTLTSWEVGHFSSQTLFTIGSTYKVQGSNNGTTWSDITGTLTYSRTHAGQSTQANNSNVAQFPNNKIAYKFYRYFGISATTGGGWATEFFFKESTCTDLDTDSDGVPNRQDRDSDGDKCTDAVEAGVISYIEETGGAVYSSGNVVNAGMSFDHPEAVVGPGTANVAAYGANGYYNPIESNDLSTAVYTNESKYTYANATNSAVADCICYAVPVTDGTALTPLHGTTTLSRGGGTMDPSQWLNPRTGAHLVLESKSKGFVITRIASPETAITDPVPGMIVYDTDDNCIKIYVDDTDLWQCFSIQTCND